MRKIVILKCKDYYDSYENISSIIAGSEYLEVDDDTYDLLSNYLGRLPYCKDGSWYRMFEYIQPDEAEDVVARCLSLKKAYEDNKARTAKKRAAAKAKSKATAIEKKRKQLEKLKKELGELP